MKNLLKQFKPPALSSGSTAESRLICMPFRKAEFH